MSSSAVRRVAITGASGLIGGALSAALRDRGDEVVHLVRRDPADDTPPGVTEVRWDPGQGLLDPASIEGVDAVVHLAGAGLGDHRWTEDYKRLIRSSRVEGTATVSSAVAALDPHPRFLSGSAMGYYGSRGDDVLTEESQNGIGFLAEVCRDWEAATWQAEQAGASVAHTRMGIVLAPRGGAMARLLPLARFGLAGPLGSGRQYWSWITLHDAVRALIFLVDHEEVTGPVNVTAPEPTPQAEVVRALGEHLRRPTVLRAPTIALRLALGEMAVEILGSQRALPTVLTEAGFRWDHGDLDDAIDWLLSEEGTRTTS
jgi:hypothetical protein